MVLMKYGNHCPKIIEALRHEWFESLLIIWNSVNTHSLFSAFHYQKFKLVSFVGKKAAVKLFVLSNETQSLSSFSFYKISSVMLLAWYCPHFIRWHHYIFPSNSWAIEVWKCNNCETFQHTDERWPRWALGREKKCHRIRWFTCSRMIII